MSGPSGEWDDPMWDPGAASLPEPEDALRAELQRESDRHLRTRADFENYRRRVERDRDVAARQGKRTLLLALLDLADDFDRALVHLDDSPEQVAEGLHGIRRSVVSLLETEGVTSFDSLSRRFDPLRHEAIATVADQNASPGTVVGEVGRGYLWNEALLRPARVMVAE